MNYLGVSSLINNKNIYETLKSINNEIVESTNNITQLKTNIFFNYKNETKRYTLDNGFFFDNLSSVYEVLSFLATERGCRSIYLSFFVNGENNVVQLLNIRIDREECLTYYFTNFLETPKGRLIPTDSFKGDNKDDIKAIPEIKMLMDALRYSDPDLSKEERDYEQLKNYLLDEMLFGQVSIEQKFAIAKVIYSNLVLKDNLLKVILTMFLSLFGDISENGLALYNHLTGSELSIEAFKTIALADIKYARDNNITLNDYINLIWEKLDKGDKRNFVILLGLALSTYDNEIEDETLVELSKLAERYSID